MPPQTASPSATSSTSALDRFLALPDHKRKAVLSQLSEDEKNSLLETLNLRTGEVRPGIHAPKPVSMTPLSAPGAGIADYLGETGEQAKKMGMAAAEGISRETGKYGPLGGAAFFLKGVAGAGAGVAHELKGEPQPGASSLSAPKDITDRLAGALDIIIGGDPGTARMHSLSGDTGAKYADISGIPLLGLLTGQVGGRLAGKVGLPGLEPTAEEITPYRRQISAMQRLMGRAEIHADPVETAHRLAAVQDLMKQEARKMGVTDEELNPTRARRAGRKMGQMLRGRFKEPQSDYVGQIRRDATRALKITDAAVKAADAPLRKTIDTYADQPVGDISETIARSLDQSAADTVDDALKNSLRNMAEKVRAARTVGDLDKIKVHANKEAAALYSNVPGKEIGATATSTYAYRLAADEIRANLYPRLQQLAGPNSGIDFTALGKREADAIAVRDGMRRVYYSQVAPTQATQDALKFGEYLFGEGPDHSFYNRHLIRKGLEYMNIMPGPGEMFNLMHGRAVGALGVAGVPESVATSFARQLALPGGTEPNRFVLPTGLPEEVTHPGNLRTVKRYEGTRQVPREGYEPVDRAGTEYPVKTPPGERRAALGTTGEATPDVSFTGPRTRTETVWQQLVTGEGPTVETKGGGILSTTDPELAKATLANIDSLLKRGGLSKTQRVRLEIARDSLGRQLRDYYAYSGQTPPKEIRFNSGQKAVRKVSRFRKRSLTGLAGVQAVRGEQSRERKGLPPLPPTPAQSEEESGAPQ